MDRSELIRRHRAEEMVWVAVRYRPDCDAVYVPEQVYIKSVGTNSVHLLGRDDQLFNFCFASERACMKWCHTKFSIITMLPPTKFPNI
jgi:hypothetical protein